MQKNQRRTWTDTEVLAKCPLRGHPTRGGRFYWHLTAKTGPFSTYCDDHCK